MAQTLIDDEQMISLSAECRDLFLQNHLLDSHFCGGVSPMRQVKSTFVLILGFWVPYKSSLSTVMGQRYTQKHTPKILSPKLDDQMDGSFWYFNFFCHSYNITISRPGWLVNLVGFFRHVMGGGKMSGATLAACGADDARNSHGI